MKNTFICLVFYLLVYIQINTNYLPIQNVAHCKISLCLLNHSKEQTDGKTADRHSPDLVDWKGDYEFAFSVNDRSLSKGVFLPLAQMAIVNSARAGRVWESSVLW